MGLVLGVVAAYVAGTFPTGSLVGRRLGADPTVHGSGNPGASNVYRLAGKRAGLLVAAVDMAKGAAPVGLALLVAGRPEAHVVWVAAVVGHVWPATRRFRGGKGVATAGGGALVLAPMIALSCALLFLIVARFGRMASLASLSIAVGFPALTAIVGRPRWEVAVSASVAAILVLRHQSNIRRMLRSQEARL